MYFKIVQRKQEVLIMSTQFTSDKEKIDKYMKKVFVHAESIYKKADLKPENYADFIFLSAIAIKINYKRNLWDEIGFNLSYKIKKLIEIHGIHKDNISMFGGFGYMCFAISCYSHHSGRLKSFSNSINSLLAKEVGDKSIKLKYSFDSTKFDNYDCISGISGALYYLLECDLKKDEACNDSIKAAVDYLIALTKKHRYKNSFVHNFHIPCEMQYLESEKKSFPNGNFNFGMAHGIMGPLVALSKAYKFGYKLNELKDAIDTYFEMYEEFVVLENDIAYWPGQISYEEYLNKTINDTSIHYASSWCYGNIGILGGMITACKNLGWTEKKENLCKQLICAMHKPLDDFYLVSPSLCHGYSSILSGYIMTIKNKIDICDHLELEACVDRIIKLSNDNSQIAKDNPNKIENEDGRLEGYLGDYSILNGVTGIIAVFSELLYNIDDYRKILLIG